MEKFKFCQELKTCDVQFLEQQNTDVIVQKIEIQKPVFDEAINWQWYKKQEKLNRDFKFYSEMQTYEHQLEQFIANSDDPSLPQEYLLDQSILKHYGVCVRSSLDDEIFMLLKCIEQLEEEKYIKFTQEYNEYNIVDINKRIQEVSESIGIIDQYSRELSAVEQNILELQVKLRLFEEREHLLLFVESFLCSLEELENSITNGRDFNTIEKCLVTLESRLPFLSELQMQAKLKHRIQQIRERSELENQRYQAMLLVNGIVNLSVENADLELCESSCELAIVKELLIKHIEFYDINELIQLIEYLANQELPFKDEIVLALSKRLYSTIEASKLATCEEVIILQKTVLSVDLPIYINKMINLYLSKKYFQLFELDAALLFVESDCKDFVETEDLSAAKESQFEQNNMEYLPKDIVIEFKENKNRTAIVNYQDKQFQVSFKAMEIINILFLRKYRVEEAISKEAEEMIHTLDNDQTLVQEYYEHVLSFLKANPGLKEIEIALDNVDFFKSESVFFNEEKIIDILLNAFEETLEEEFKDIFVLIEAFPEIVLAMPDAYEKLTTQHSEEVQLRIEDTKNVVESVVKSFKSSNEATVAAKRELQDQLYSVISDILQEYCTEKSVRIGIMNSENISKNRIGLCQIIIDLMVEQEIITQEEQEQIRKFFK